VIIFAPMTLLVALAFAAGSYVIQSDYCHRWATADIQAVAQCEVTAHVPVQAVGVFSGVVIPLPSKTRDAFVTPPTSNRPRESVCTKSSGN